MSLAGIAVAIGAMVDAAIVVVEQTHKKLEHWDAGGRREDYREVVIGAVKEVGRPAFFSLAVLAIAFLPVFTLEAPGGPPLQAARLHQDLLDRDRRASSPSPSTRPCASSSRG